MYIRDTLVPLLTAAIPNYWTTQISPDLKKIQSPNPLNICLFAKTVSGNKIYYTGVARL